MRTDRVQMRRRVDTSRNKQAEGISHSSTCIQTNTDTVYLCGAGAGFHPGAELILRDLAVVVSAVEQAERHRVLLPGEPARITQSLEARQGVSCTEMERESKTPLSLRACRHLTCPFPFITRSGLSHILHSDHEAADAVEIINKHGHV